MRGHLLTLLILGTAVAANAQWNGYPTAGAPRLANGKVDMNGAVPKMGGKPDLSGVWQVQAEPRGPGLFGLGESPNSKYFRNVLSDFKAGEEPFTPAGLAAFQKGANNGGLNPSLICQPDGVPHGDLLPEPFKIIQTPGELVLLYEVENTFRQVFTDNRKHPADPSPTWNGYSVGRWEGDTLIVDTLGFNSLSSLDAFGHMHSEDMRVEERFHRKDYGHMDLQITITDPKTFTKPIVFSVVEELMPDTDVFEAYCVEGEQDASHQPGRGK